MFSLLKENIKKAYIARQVSGIISLSHKLIYFPVPKVATSTVKRFLAETGAVEVYAEKDSNFKYIHDYVFPTIRESELKKYRNYYTFSIVRNPVDRIYSCYKDKIIRRLENDSPLYPGFRRYNTISHTKLFKRDMSFPAFIKTIAMIPDALSDEHFRSQYRFIPHNNHKLLVNRLLKMESLSKGLAEVFAQAGLDFSNAHHVNATIEQERPYEIDSKTKKKIKERYAKDFKYFDY